MVGKASTKKPEDWIRIHNHLPEEGQYVWYYFEPCGVNYGQYKGLVQGLPQFAGPLGVLTGDVTHWLPAPPPPGTGIVYGVRHE